MEKAYDQYQIPCLEAIHRTREANANKALVVMAGGLGKTVVGARDVRHFLQGSRKKVLCLCHMDEVLTQNKKTFEQIVGPTYTYGMFTGRRKDKDADMLFATFQTIRKPIWQELFAKDEFAYIVVDEAHHIRAKTFERALSYFEPEFLLGLTATPNREDGKSLAPIFGEPVFQLGFAEAWSRRYLTPVEYLLATKEMVSPKKLLQKNVKFSLKNLNKAMFRRLKDEEVVEDVKAQTKDLKDPRMIVFCRSVEQVERVVPLFDDAVPLHYQLSPSERDANMQAFREGRAKTIVVRDMLNEGVDVPATDVIVRLRMTDSRVLFEQQLARGLRLCEGKKQVRVLDYANDVQHLKWLFELEEQVAQVGATIFRGQGKTEREECVPKFEVKLTGEVQKVDLKALLARTRTVWVNCTDQEVLTALWNLGQRLGRPPTQLEMVHDRLCPCPSEIRRRFQTLRRALILAGFDPKDLYVRLGTDLIMDELVQWVLTNKRYPTREDLVNKVACTASVNTVFKYFGPNIKDLVMAIREALGEDAEGIELPVFRTTERHVQPPRRFTNEEKRQWILQIVQTYLKEHGLSSLTRRQFEADLTLPAVGTVKKVFGVETYSAMLMALGCEPVFDREERMKFFDRTVMLDYLKQLYARLGRPIRGSDIDEDESVVYTAKSFDKKFKNLGGALKAAGLPVPYNNRWHPEGERGDAELKERYIAIYQEQYQALGKDPSLATLEKVPEFSAMTMRRLFGSKAGLLQAVAAKG